MKRVIMPVIMLVAIMQLNGGAAGRANALWSATRTSGLLRPSGQQVLTAGKGVYPAGSRLLATGSPATATRLSGRFSGLAKTPTPQAERGSYWSFLKGMFAPGAAVATAAYIASQEEGQEKPAGTWLSRLPRGYAAAQEEETARAFHVDRDITLAVPEASNLALIQATKARNDAQGRYHTAEEMKNEWKLYGDHTSGSRVDPAYDAYYAEVEKVADAAQKEYEQAEEQYSAAKAHYDAARHEVEQSSRIQE